MKPRTVAPTDEGPFCRMNRRGLWCSGADILAAWEAEGNRS